MKIFKYLAALFFVSALALTGCSAADADPPERSETRVPLTISPSAAPEPATPAPPPATLPPAPETTEPEPEPTEEKTSTIVYEITGDGGTAASVSWGTMNGASNGFGIEQAMDAPLPFRVEVPLDELGRFETNIFTLNAQDAGFGTSISCKISWKESGVVVAEQTSTGPYSVVMCSK